MPHVAPVWVSDAVTIVSGSIRSTFGLRRRPSTAPAGKVAAKPCSAVSYTKCSSPRADEVSDRARASTPGVPGRNCTMYRSGMTEPDLGDGVAAGGAACAPTPDHRVAPTATAAVRVSAST